MFPEMRDPCLAKLSASGMSNEHLASQTEGALSIASQVDWSLEQDVKLSDFARVNYTRSAWSIV